MFRKKINLHRRYYLDELAEMIRPKMIECNIGEAYFYNSKNPDRKGRPETVNVYYTLNPGGTIDDIKRFENWLWDSTYHRVAGYCTIMDQQALGWARNKGIPIHQTV